VGAGRLDQSGGLVTEEHRGVMPPSRQAKPVRQTPQNPERHDHIPWSWIRDHIVGQLRQLPFYLAIAA
jgi:hypothetical protein